MGRQVAIEVVDHDGSVVTVGRSKTRADNTAADLIAHGTETTTPPAANAKPSREGTSK
jgi:hypothetical protein